VFANEYSFLEGCLNDVEVKQEQKQKEAENEERKRNKEIAEQERSNEQAKQKLNKWQAERQTRIRKANAELLIKQNEDMKEAKEQMLETLLQQKQETEQECRGKKDRNEERRKMYNNFCCGVNNIYICENPNLRIVYDKAHCNICLKWRCRHSFNSMTL